MIFLGIGSNLSSQYGNRFENIKLAISFLKKYSIKVVQKSSYYETPSYPNKKFPKFINIVVSVESSLLPIELMSTLILIENKLERTRVKKNTPRTCDIDIIDYNSKIFNLKYKSSHLVIPHEGLTTRNFVLYPLQEISPKWKHPETKEIISVFIEKLNEEDKNSILMIDEN